MLAVQAYRRAQPSRSQLNLESTELSLTYHYFHEDVYTSVAYLHVERFFVSTPYPRVYIERSCNLSVCSARRVLFYPLIVKQWLELVFPRHTKPDALTIASRIC